MFEATDIPRDQQMLGELAEMDLALAKHVFACCRATEDTAEVVDLSRAYQRIARSLRQSLALKAKLDRERAQDAARQSKPEPAPRGRADDPATVERVCDLQDAIGRIAVAALPDDAERVETLVEDLDCYFSYETERPDFLTHPLDDHIRAHCVRLGLPEDLVANWRDLPPAPWTVGQLFADDDAGPDPDADASRFQASG